MNKAILAALLLFTLQDTHLEKAHAPSVYFRPRYVPPPPPAPQAVGPITLGAGADQTIIMDEYGNLNVIWTGPPSNPTASYFSRSTNQGLAWSAPVILPSTTAAMAIEQNGAIDVVYICNPSVTSCSGNVVDLSVQLIRSVDEGNTWSAPLDVSLPNLAGGYGADEPVIAACGGGIVLAWEDDGHGADIQDTNTDIFLEYIVGGVPQAPINLSNTPASEGHPQITVNSQSTVFVTWVTEGPSIVFSSVLNCGVK
jgi:hypothetical protein